MSVSRETTILRPGIFKRGVSHETAIFWVGGEFLEKCLFHVKQAFVSMPTSGEIQKVCST